MAIALTLVPFDYVLKEDRKLDTEDQTVWKLRRLSISEQAQIEDATTFAAKNVSKDQKGKDVEFIDHTPRGTLVKEVLRIGLKGWVNFKQANGDPQVWVETGKDGMCNMENLNAIEPKHREELAIVIEQGAKVMEEDAKNSESESGSEKS